MSKKLEENSKHTIVINLDPDINFLKLSPSNIWLVRAIGQRLPFKPESIAGVFVKAALHHTYSEFDLCLAEIHRVLDDKGVVSIQEPLDVNPLSRIARKFFTLEGYDPNERPFNPKYLLNSFSRYFEIRSIKLYYLTSYLLPHIIARMPLKVIWRGVASLLSQLDRWLLENCHFARKYAEYIEIIATKKVICQSSCINRYWGQYLQKSYRALGPESGLMPH